MHNLGLESEVAMERYRTIRAIGEGSFGKVALVQERKGRARRLVMKQVEVKSLAVGEQEKVMREVKLLSELQHPNIVQYVESFTEGGCVNMVMEYCEAGDLFTFITNQRGRPLQEELILFFFLQVAGEGDWCRCAWPSGTSTGSTSSTGTSRPRTSSSPRWPGTSQCCTAQGWRLKLGDFGIARILDGTVDYAKTCIGALFCFVSLHII